MSRGVMFAIRGGMTRYRLSLIVFLVLALHLGRPSAASADAINFLGTGKGLVVSIDSPALGTINVHAGELKWHFVPPTPAGLATQFLAFCVDVNNWVRASQVVTLRSSDALEVGGVTDAGEKAAWLVNTFAPGIHSGGTNTEAAGLQVPFGRRCTTPVARSPAGRSS